MDIVSCNALQYGRAHAHTLRRSLEDTHLSGENVVGERFVVAVNHVVADVSVDRRGVLEVLVDGLIRDRVRAVSQVAERRRNILQRRAGAHLVLHELAELVPRNLATTFRLVRPKQLLRGCIVTTEA